MGINAVNLRKVIPIIEDNASKWKKLVGKEILFYRQLLVAF